MRKKRVLLLGGSRQQIPVIQKAKDMGLYVITCDYLPDNPGHVFADEYHNISTIDEEGIYMLAKELQVDGVVCYASDPSARAAAYASEKLGLATNSYESVCILTDKGRFRKILEENGFNTPKSKTYTCIRDVENDIADFRYPLIIKPVDSSGSKGVTMFPKDSDALNESKLNAQLTLELGLQVDNAMKFSNSGQIILEEYVESSTYQVAGDGFCINGKLAFRLFGDDHFYEDSTNPFVPVAATFPSVLSDDIQNKIHFEIQRLFDVLGMKTGAFNFDIRVNNDEVFLMEVGPRNGGNYIPQVIELYSDFDMVEATIKAALGESIQIVEKTNSEFYCYYSVNSAQDGILEKVNINKSFSKKHIIDEIWNIKPGEKVNRYYASNCTLGILILSFNNSTEMLECIYDHKKWIEVFIKHQ